MEPLESVEVAHWRVGPRWEHLRYGKCELRARVRVVRKTKPDESDGRPWCECAGLDVGGARYKDDERLLKSETSATVWQGRESVG